MMSLQAMSCVSRKGGMEKVGDCAGSVLKNGCVWAQP